MIYAATVLALLVLCGLVGVWGRRQLVLVRHYRQTLYETRGRLQRCTRERDLWHTQANRLKSIVDRVEG